MASTRSSPPTTTLGQLFPGAPLAYRIPWKGRPAAGTYRVLGTIRPQGARIIRVKANVTVTGAKAKQLAHGTTAAAQRQAATSIPGWVWIALAIAAVLLVVIPLFVWKHAPPRREHSGRGELSIPVRRLAVVIVVAGVVAVGSHVGEARAALGPAPVTLGTAASFGVLAGTTVTSVAFGEVDGNVGVSPGIAITGFPPSTADRKPVRRRSRSRRRLTLISRPPTGTPSGAPRPSRRSPPTWAARR